MTTIWEQQQRINHDALPFREGLADIFGIDWMGGKTSEALLRSLLNGEALTFGLQENVNPDLPLLHWYQESRVREQISGQRALGLGFPLFVFSGEEALTVAPLFIWRMALIPHPHTPGMWQLSYHPGYGVESNPWLIHYLEGRLPAEEVERLRALPLPEWEELAARLEKTAGALGWRVGEEDAPRLIPCPALGELSEAAERGAIVHSAVIGAFPPPELRTAALDTGSIWENDAGLAEGHTFGYANLDPHQATAFHHLRSGDSVVIDGAVGTGKTHLAKHLLTNALSNGQKVLILSPTTGDLEEIQAELTYLGLETLCLAVTDPIREEEQLARTIRAAAEADALPSDHDEAVFQQLLSKWEREKQKLDDRYHALRKPVFGDFAWADTVGLFLASNRRQGKELLSANLNRQDFQFTHREFETLKVAVGESYPLYQQINTLRHPLNDLHPDLFLTREEAEARAFLSEQLTVFIRKCGLLHKRYIARADEYAGQLQAFYEGWYEELARRTDRLIEKTEDDVSAFGRDYELTSMLSLRLYGGLFGRFRRMRKAKEATFAAYRELVQQFQANPQFDFSFAPATEGRMLPRMRQSLSEFRGRLTAWREQLPAMVREELARLSNKTVHPRLPFEGHVRELEEALDLQLAELNQAALYEEPFENRMLTIQKRRKYLEGVIEQLENTRLFLTDFDRFYPWRRHWLQLTEPAQKLVQALIKVKPADWATAFESWYLNNCLVKAYSTGLPGTAFSLRQYVYNHDQLRDKLLPQIRHRWAENRRNLLRELRREDRPRYQLLNAKKTDRTALAGLLRAEPNLVAGLLPVWLLTPHAAAQLNLPPGVFDYVIVKKAQLLTFQQAGPGLAAGQRRLFFGDSQQAMLGPGARSLLAEATEKAAVRCRLPVIHRWNPGDALRLVQPGRVLDEAIGRGEVHAQEVGGSFDEHRQTNEAEAREAVRLLQAIAPLPGGSYPSVGIVAFTKGQRDLIAGYLLEVRQRQMEGAEKLNSLESAGLGVYALEDLLGRHPEVLIVSCTYGCRGPEGPLTDRIQQLNRSEGEALLSLLMSRPSRRLQLLHSLPEASVKIFSNDFGKRGTFLLANYLYYIYSLQEAEAETQQLIIQKLSNHFPGKNRPDAWVSPFLREVAIALQPYFTSERIHLDERDAHVHLPLKIDPLQSENNPIVLLPDGFFGRTIRTDYRWEFGQWEYFADHHYNVLPIWSVNWWKSAQQECRKLASTIIDQLEQPPEKAEG